MPDRPAHIALLLAAGASRRLGHPKQLVVIDGITLIRRMVLAALATRPLQLYVALGAEISGCSAALAGLPLQILICHDWQRGMGATLAQAVAACGHADAGLLVLGVDQPHLNDSHLRRLLEQWKSDRSRPVASGYGNTLGTPVIFPAHWRDRLANLSGDQGARALLRTEATDVTVMPAPELALDLDDAQDFATLHARDP